MVASGKKVNKKAMNVFNKVERPDSPLKQPAEQIRSSSPMMVPAQDSMYKGSVNFWSDKVKGSVDINSRSRSRSKSPDPPEFSSTKITKSKGNPMSRKEESNPILLNCRELDQRSTMQEIIDGYPYVNKHKELIKKEKTQLNNLHSQQYGITPEPEFSKEDSLMRLSA